MLKLFFIIVAALINLQLHGQVVLRYNSPANHNDEAYDMIVDRYSNIYLAGKSDTLTGIYPRPMPRILKYSSSGDLLWTRKENITGNFSKILLDSSGTLWAAGKALITGSHYSVVLFKYDVNGVFKDSASIFRQDSYGMETTDLSTDGYNILIAFEDFGLGDTEYYTVHCYDSTLNLLWINTFTNQYAFYDSKPKILNDNLSSHLYTVYSSYYNTANGYDVCLRKISKSSGNSIWTRFINHGGSEYHTNAVLDQDEIYFTGAVTGLNSGWSCFLFKSDSSANVLWHTRFNSPDSLDGAFYNLTLDNSRNIVATGALTRSNNVTHLITNKYTNSGNMIWNRSYTEGVYLTRGYQIVTDSYCNVYSAGRVGTIPDYALIKYDSSGNQVYIRKYNGPGNSEDLLSRLVIDNIENLYLTGRSVGSTGNFDFLTIKYLYTTNTPINSIDAQNGFFLFQNYPNPFNPKTTITYELKKTGNVTLKIYSIGGKELLLLVNKKQSPGEHSVQFDGGGLPSGIYFYRLQTEDFVESKRMILLK